MIGRCEQRRECRVELVGPDGPIRKLPIPARDHRVKVRNRHQRVGSGRADRVARQMIFEQSGMHLVIPAVHRALRCLPVECIRLIVEWARFRVEEGEFRLFFGRVIGKRRPGPELAAAAEHPGLPGPAEWT